MDGRHGQHRKHVVIKNISTMKKLFIISSVLLFIVLVLLGVYNFAFKKDKVVNLPQVQVEQVANEDTKKELIIKKEKIVAVSSGQAVGVSINKKTGELKYYNPTNGSVWKIEESNGKAEKIVDTKLKGLIKNASWSPDLSRSLLETSLDGKNVFYQLESVSSKEVLLKNGLDTAVWDNLGTKIFYKYYDEATKKRTLNIANPDGSDWQKVADIENRNISIAAIPLTSLVSFWNYPNADEESKLQTVGITGGEIKTISSGKKGADYLWAPNGSRALVSSLSANDKKSMTLGMVTIDGVYQDLGIPTLVSKCAWSDDNKTIYYALPGEIPTDATMPNDYQESKFTTADTFWKMDISTGEKSRIVEARDIVGKYDSSNLLLSSAEEALYFINKIDKKLYRIEL